MTNGLCSPTYNPKITSVQAMEVEFLLTLILVWVCCGVWDTRNSSKNDSAPIRIGLSVTALILAGAHYSGSNLNPARSFGPALINLDWEDHWVYWVGPIGAGFVGGLVYRIVFNKENPNESSHNEAQVFPDKT